MDLKNNPHASHRNRLRARYLRDGINGFNDHEKLELLLFYSIPVKDTNKLAHDLLDNFGGSISSVFEASVEDLCQVPGIGYNTAVLIKLVQSMAGVYLDDKACDVDTLDTKEKIVDFVKYKFVDKQVEYLMVVCLDCRKRVLYHEFVSRGTVNATAINKRIITEIALKHRASSIIIAHNHPQGFSLASREDRLATDSIAETMRIFGIGLDDSLIVADGGVYSLKDNKIYKPHDNEYDAEMSE